MVNSPDYVAHAAELLSAGGPVRTCRMFGGHGFYVAGHFLALVAGDVLYLKTDVATRSAFEAAGCRPFEFTPAGGKRVVMGYWTVPDEAMEAPEAMQPWARLAMDSALRAAADKRPAAPRKPCASVRKAPARKPSTPKPAPREP